MTDITIDVSEVSWGISGVEGMIRAVEDIPEHIAKGIPKDLDREIGARADALGTSELAHVYEYGMEGMASGRLWDIIWDRGNEEILGRFTFKESNEPAPVDPRLESYLAPKGISLARHVFPNKADFYESEQTLTSVAGRTWNTYRSGGSGQGKFLIFWSDHKNQPMFIRSMSRENKYMGNFEEFVTNFFGTVGMEQYAEEEIKQAARTISTTVDELQRVVAATPKVTSVVAEQGLRVVSNGINQGVQYMAPVAESFKKKLISKLFGKK